MTVVRLVPRQTQEPVPFPMVAPAPTEVRAPGSQGYCPWEHLGHLPGVTLTWHDNGPRGLTDFATLTISLRRGLTGPELRSTLAHELVHIERGPGRGPGWPNECVRARIEEDVVDATAVTRLIPTGVLEDLPELVDQHGREAALALLYIDESHLDRALRLVEGARR
jgi:hypothetical protein